MVNDTYSISATKPQWSTYSNVVIIAGTNETAELYISLSASDKIPLLLFMLFVVIGIGCVVVAFRYDDEIGVFNILCAFIGTFIAYMNSKILINGMLVESFEFASSIQTSAFSYLFNYIAIIMGIMTLLLTIMYIKEQLEEEDVL